MILTTKKVNELIETYKKPYIDLSEKYKSLLSEYLALQYNIELKKNDDIR